MILVTGGTGAVGSELLRLLSRAGIPARALVRNLDKAQKLPGITWVAADLARPETLTTAFEGAESVFLLTHYFEDMVQLQRNAIAGARAAGVPHVVKVSAFAASGHSKAPIGRWHYQVEQELQASGMGWTMLRPHHFMLNLLAQAEYVIKEGALYSPSGDGKIPYIDPRDVAAVAFVTLTQPGHLGKTYVLTGSEAISYRQLRRSSAPQSARNCGSSMSLQSKRGPAAFEKVFRPPSSKAFSPSVPISARAEKTVTITNTVAELVGRPARTVAEFVQEHASVFLARRTRSAEPAEDRGPNSHKVMLRAAALSALAR